MIFQQATRLKKLSAMAILIASAFIQSGCSKDNDKNISIDIVPHQPVVVLADFEMLDSLNSTPGNPVYKTITAPWIKFSYNLTNNNPVGSDVTTKSVTIVAVTLDISGFTLGGQQVFATSKFSAADASGYSPTVSPPYLAFVQPGDKISAGLPSSNGSYDGTSWAGNFYAMSLPDLVGGGTTPGTTPAPILGTYNFQIRATFTGWYGSFDNPQTRFTKVISFSTQ